MNRTQPTRGLKVLLALHAGALVACAWLVREVAADATPAPAPEHARADEPHLTLEPGEWAFDGAAFAPIAPAASAPLVPMPPAAPRVAVRAHGGRVGAELYGPVSVPDVVACWRAAGWTVTEAQTDDRPRFDLRRDGRDVVAWLLRSRTGSACHVLITPVNPK